MYVDTWHLAARLPGSAYILTCYGIKTEAEAREVAQKVLALAEVVEMTHTTKETKRSSWKSERTLIKR